MPVGSNVTRSGVPGPQPTATPSQANVSGGLSIGGHKEEDGELDDADRANKRRRRGLALLDRRTLLRKVLLQLRTIVLPLPRLPTLPMHRYPHLPPPFDEHPRTEVWCATSDDYERITATVPHVSSSSIPSTAEHTRSSTLPWPTPARFVHRTIDDGTHGLWVHSAPRLPRVSAELTTSRWTTMSASSSQSSPYTIR